MSVTRTRTEAIRNNSFHGRLAFYAAGLRRLYRFLPDAEIRQSVAVGLLEARSLNDEKRMAAKAVYRLAYNLGWHRVRDPETKKIVWASEKTWVFRAGRMKALCVRDSY